MNDVSNNMLMTYVKILTSPKQKCNKTIWQLKECNVKKISTQTFLCCLYFHFGEYLLVAAINNTIAQCFYAKFLV